MIKYSLVVINMILYRVIPKNNPTISNKKTKGINTFKYDEKIDYLHFFILPQNAYIYQLLQYGQNNIESIILKCDIPLNKLTFGVGLYFWYYRFKRVPFLEARINTNDFQKEYIKEISSYVRHEWNNFEIFKKYLINCIYNQKAFTYIDKENYIIKLNPNYNFLEYFTKDDLEKENIILNNSSKDESLRDLKKKELSRLNRILITLKENIEDLSINDDVFLNLDYYEKKYK